MLLPLWSIGHQWNALFHFNSLILRQSVGRTPWTGNQLVARPLPNTNTEWTQTDIHASSGIRTHYPSVRASEDTSFLRLRDHCQLLLLTVNASIVSPQFSVAVCVGISSCIRRYKGINLHEPKTKLSFDRPSTSLNVLSEYHFIIICGMACPNL
jgi:hypothetical protein